MQIAYQSADSLSSLGKVRLSMRKQKEIESKSLVGFTLDSFAESLFQCSEAARHLNAHFTSKVGIQMSSQRVNAIYSL